jgi:hypothetical protein
MASQTTNYKLIKPSGEDYYDISVQNDNMDIIDQTMTDFDAQIVGGTATAITIVLKSINKYRAGMKVTVIASRDNGGAATTLKLNTLESKPVYKPNSTTAPKLTSGKPYTFILSSDLSYFFLDASAEGDAVAANVLAGKIFSNDDDTGLTGTMVNNGSVGIQTLTMEGAEYTIPEGYHNGLGKVKATITNIAAAVIKAGTTVGGVVGTYTSDATATAAGMLSGITAYVNGLKITGTIPSKSAATITPGTTAQTIAAGQYLSGVQTIKGDANLLGANILSGKTIFNVNGAILNKVGSGTVITPSGLDQAIPEGYYDGAVGSGKVAGITLSAGDNLLAAADTQVQTGAAGWLKIKEIQVVSHSGVVRVKYDGCKSSSSSSYPTCVIYKNGGQVGAMKDMTATYSSFITYTEDIAVTAGDLIQLYGMRGDSSTYPIIKNFRLCTAITNIITKVIKDA